MWAWVWRPGEPGEGPQVVAAQDTKLDVGLREGARNQRIVQASLLVCLTEEPEEVGFMDGLLLDGEVRAALVAKSGGSDVPSGTLLTDSAGGGDEHVFQEHLGELCITGHLHERTYLDTIGVHVDCEHAEAPASAGFTCAGQTEAPVGELSVGSPYLGPAEEVAALDGLGSRGKRGKVATRIGFGKELAPYLARIENAAQPSAALLDCAVDKECRSDQVDADPVDRLGYLGTCRLGEVYGHLQRGSVAAAELGRPVDAYPAVCRHLCLESATPLELLVEAGERRPRGEVVGNESCDPFTDLGGKDAILIGKGKVHEKMVGQR